MLAGAYAVAFLDRALVSVAGAPIKQDLALTDGQFGLLSGTAFALLFAVGLLTDRLFADERMLGLALLMVLTSAALAGPLLAGAREHNRTGASTAPPWRAASGSSACRRSEPGLSPARRSA